MHLLKRHKLLILLIVILLIILILKKTNIRELFDIGGIVDEAKSKVMDGVNVTIDVAKKEVENVKDDALKSVNALQKEVNSLKNSVEIATNKAIEAAKEETNKAADQIKKDFYAVTDPLGELINNFGNIFNELGPLFNEIFDPVKRIVNILVATFNFSIRIINKMKKCNFLYIKSTPIRVRFRDTITKLMEVSILSMQMMNPNVFFNPFAYGNYLYNINIRLINIAGIITKNLALDWSDLSKLDIKGCFSIDEFYDLGNTYINEMKELAGTITSTAENVKKILDKLSKLVPLSPSSIKIDFSLLPFMKNPWSPDELLSSYKESEQFRKTVVDFISKLTNKNTSDLQQILEDGLKAQRNYAVDEFKKVVNT